MDGVKHSKEKPNPYILFKQFPNALMAVARQSGFGHEKYKEFDKDFMNWQKVPNAYFEYSGSLSRHFIQENIEEVDEESKLPHQVAVAWNALARLELYLKENNL